MRRGLLSWSHEELPPAVLQGLVVRMGRKAAERGLAGVAVYGDSTRPAALSRLTNLIPSWSGSYLFVSPAGQAELIIGNGGKRGIPHTRTLARVDSIHPTGNFGQGLAERVKAAGATGAIKLGVVELDSFPSGALANLRKALPGIELVDATDLLEAPGDDEAVFEKIAAHCADIARQSVAAGLKASGAGRSSPVVAAVDGAARLAGAEDTFIAIAPDALADPRLRRIEGDVALGPVITLQLSVGYKGQWVRLARTAAIGGAKEPAWMAPLAPWFDALAASPALLADPAAAIEAAARRLPGATVEFWRIEGAKGTLPLAALAGSAPLSSRPPALRGTATLSIRLKTPQGSWFAAEPLTLGQASDRKAA